ncbi:MAG: rhomboid family intramembrane serine protease [Pseudomonadota bacterium]
MFPLRDHNPSNQTPYVTYALIVINVVIFVAYWPLFSDPGALSAFYSRWGLVPQSAMANPFGFLTSMFLHGGLMHLGGNMLFLWIFGDNLEDEMGHGAFLGFYLASGIGAALVQIMSEPRSPIPMIGASGAIAGVMGGYLLLFPKARVDILVILIVLIRIFPVPAWVMLGLWFALQLIGGFGSAPGTGGVAYWAHAGGFAVGLALSVPLWLRLGATSFWQRTHGHPPHPEAHYPVGRSRIPRVRRRK